MIANDRSIIIALYKRTRNKELNWYKLNKNITDVWKSSEKITNNKSISYSIFHRKDDPEESHLIIYLEKRFKRNNSGVLTIFNNVFSELIKIKTIKNSSTVLMLLRMIMESTGDKIIKTIVGVIQKKQDDKILLIKSKTGTWKLPGGIINKKSMEETLIKSIQKKTGLIPTNTKILGYRNIFNHKNNIYNVVSYLIKDYYGELIKSPKNDLCWVNIDDIFNYYIEEETLKILKSYKKTLVL